MVFLSLPTILAVKLNRLNINIVLLGVVSFLTDVSSEMMMPILPMFIVALGGTAFVVGLIGGLGDSVSSILQVFSGYWSDKHGKRKPFVFLGYLTSAISKLFLPLSVVWQHVLILRPLERVGKGLRTAPRDALIADSAEAKIRGLAFGIHRAMDSGGAVLGSILALILFLFLGLDFRIILLVSAIIAFFALPIILPVKDLVKEPNKKLVLQISLKALPKKLRLLILIMTVFALGNFTYMFFVLRAYEFFSELYVGAMVFAIPILLYVFFNLAYTFFSIPCGILSDKLGRKKVLLTGYLLFCLVCLGFTLASSTPMFILLFLLYGLTYALVDGTQRAFISDLAPQELKGTALGTFHTAIGLATFPSGLIAGILWQCIGFNATFFYGFTLSLIAFILLKTLV